MTTSPNVTKQQLLNAWTKISHDTITPAHSNDVIDILGGLPNVLTMILSSDDIQLNEQQLIQLENITNNISRPSIANQNIIRQVPENESPEEWAYCFDRNNTYLHYLFGNDKGQKIFNFVLSKKCVLGVGSLTGLGIVWLMYFALIDNYAMIHGLMITLISLGVIYIPYLILVLLSVNIECFKMILKSFEFWFKLFYCLQSQVARFVWIFVLLTPEEWPDHPTDSGSNLYKLQLIFQIVLSIAQLLVILVVISIDALQMKFGLKIFFGCCAAVYSSMFAVNLTFSSRYYENPKSIIHIKALNSSFSVVSVRAGALQILSIFIWKQVFLSIIKRNRCVLIKYSPYLRWVDKDQSGNVEEIQMTTIMDNKVVSMHQMKNPPENMTGDIDLDSVDEEEP